MKHFIFSVYYKGLNPEIKLYQKKVFDHFTLDIEQIEVKPVDFGDSLLLPEILNSRQDWEFATIFDIDCIPLTVDVFKNYFSLEDYKNTLYGNAQASNVFPGEIKSLPYVSPHFMTFSRGMWEDLYTKLGPRLFIPTHYPNPDGKKTQADRGERLTREAEKFGYKLKIEYPTEVKIPKWSYGGEFGMESFTFGVGTTYGNLTYHNYEIRIEGYQELFIEKCEYILNSSPS